MSDEPRSSVSIGFGYRLADRGSIPDSRRAIFLFTGAFHGG
jgi:hypothetical protein